MSDDAPERDSVAAAIEDLVIEFLDRREGEGPVVLDELCRRAPEHAARLRARVASLERAGLIESEQREILPERLGEFRVLKRLGSGGMGVVFLAEQPSLGRRAAVKVVRPEHLWLPSARERFQREALAVARLAHPAIVPVYTVGEDGGIPFLAMEYVEGATLADLISDLRARPASDLTGSDLRAALDARLAHDGLAASSDSADVFAGSWTTACTRVAIAIARALEHAHGRGVLHRDLKPSNVMIDRAGRPRLLDFGLATREGADRITRTGSQMGSMPYMAPEQVEGRAEQIGPRTDVYGLAVTLYEALALRLPFDERSTVALARRIVDGEHPALRSLNPKVPRDLETVIAKALDRDPARRYATAAEFADDLENALALRPIAARRQGWFARSVRWSQRHPARATTAILASTLVLGGPVVFAWKERETRLRVQDEKLHTDEANRQLELALGEARDERKHSQTNFEHALDAVALLTDVGATQLADVPEADDARRQLLEGALQFQQTLAAERRDRPEFVLELARTEIRVGEILQALSRNEESEIVLSSTVNTLGKRLERETDDDVRRLFVTASRKYARTLHSLERFADAARQYQVSLDELARVPESSATSDDVRNHAEILRELSRSLQLNGDKKGTIDALDRSGQLFALLQGRDPSDPRTQVELAKTYIEYLEQKSDLVFRTGEDGAAFQIACDLMDKALPYLRMLARRSPAGSTPRRELGDALVGQGKVLHALERNVEAVEALQEAVPFLRESAQRHPLIANYQVDLTRALGMLSQTYITARCGREALSVSMEAVESQRTIVERFPERKTARAGLAFLQSNLANDLSNAQQPHEALRCAREAVDLLTAYLVTNPKDRIARTVLVRTRCNMVLNLCEIGDWSTACQEADSIPTEDTADLELMRAACWGRIESVVRRRAATHPELVSLADEALERMYLDVESAAARGRTKSAWLQNGPLFERADEPRFKPLLERLRSDAAPRR